MDWNFAKDKDGIEEGKGR